MILKIRNYFALKVAASIAAVSVIVGIGVLAIGEMYAFYKRNYGVVDGDGGPWFLAFVAMVFWAGLGGWVVQNALSAWRGAREEIDRLEAIKVRPSYWNVMQALRTRKLYNRIKEAELSVSFLELPVLSVVASLLSGADPNSVCKGRPIIFHVSNAKHAKWLAWAGADVNVICDRREGTGVLIEPVKYDNLALVQEWLIAGANPNAKDNDGCTPLFYARSAEMERLLLIHGADPTVRDKKGNLAQESKWSIKNQDCHADLIAAAEEINEMKKELLID
ncbi:hypothetical protein N5D45_06780 [Stenotrophomonas sp. GD03819]|jgi:ankyrin repeat protein|uniref:ankyrin repeat domain-containing protein n=1 Tax=Stenotrophomonas TaxID=40323 RepID=UPI001146A5ED|nr:MULTISPECIES: ankyrin repeat domain-containing protein [Stenotrophomonas]MBA0233258.1 ankyrin repeat domain-containing protein [Stenotrophomonas maltophilia]MBA0267297.1 ankyrin repeat domain-containing protein [Stenotrophomonas maltophilia]MBA0455244.1 ankyrin repeat domain-containing protein [Stenotrophomonas maltophilia]MCD5965546.1 hypothetical protein [Stenotrophomonas maltophilia]MDH1791524.1 hypothetical protein [Stenotrophomonas sp. GD03819]